MFEDSDSYYQQYGSFDPQRDPSSFVFKSRVESLGQLDFSPTEVTGSTKEAYFGMGWFYHPEALFGATEGVIQTSVGYAGGTKKHPTYQDLGDHTEVVRIVYDPTEIDYKQLLSIFRNNHNPSMHYQKQYWSIILYNSEEQLIAAQECLQFLQKTSSSIIHTKILM